MPSPWTTAAFSALPTPLLPRSPFFPTSPTTSPALPVPRPRRHSTLHAAATPSMLFGLGGRNDRAKNKPSSASSSGTNPFRALGVTEDASYEEVESAFNALRTKYADDAKKIMWLEIQKDKIFDTRLAQRMSGELSAKVKVSPFERALPKKKRFVAPQWLQGLIRLPERKYLRRCSLVMSIFAVLGFVTPTLVGSTMAMSFIAAAGFLYNRGLPDVVRDDYGNPGEVREVKWQVFVKTLGVNLGLAAVGFGLGQLWLLYGAVPGWVQVDSVVNLFVVAGLWVSCVVFQVQEEGRY